MFTRLSRDWFELYKLHYSSHEMLKFIMEMKFILIENVMITKYKELIEAGINAKSHHTKHSHFDGIPEGYHLPAVLVCSCD